MKYILLLLPLLLFSCKKEANHDTETRRQEWLTSLQDSISSLKQLQTQDSVEIISLREQIDENLKNFTVVNNPREVEAYYILSPFRGNYPLNSTGIAARMLKSQKLEIVAALSGSRFNSISVTDATGSVTSDIVPADQGLNYTTGGLTTVAFSGAKADSIGEFIATSSSPLTLNYLQGGKRIASQKLSDAQKRWIGNTWTLTNMRSRLDSLENAQMLNARKIELLVLTLHKNSQS